MKHPLLYLAVVGGGILSLVGTLTAFPRPSYSELERRDLKVFPTLSWQSLSSGDFTENVSEWFSDTEPFRDVLLQGAMWFRGNVGITMPGDQVRYLKEADAPEQGEDKTQADTEDEPEGGEDEYAKAARAGIVLVGKGDKVRALMGFFASEKYGLLYAKVVNQYQQVLGDSVQVYCMPIPTSTEFYLPEGISTKIKKQRPFIDAIFSSLSGGAKAVDIYDILKEHKREAIYLRTDHHWAPLGAYYAASVFAKEAGVPFRDLSHYQADTVHRYVGTMYGYSKDISVKNAPEDFVWFKPKDAEYTTSYIKYSLCKQYHITGERPWRDGPFFYPRKDGEASAYQTFMNSDGVVCRVRTSVGNGRRLIILKDSFGNALPGYLFYSFEEIHVIDGRYFTKNLVSYVKENHITDVLFANNTGLCCSSFILGNYRRYLTQKHYSYCHTDHDKESAKDSTSTQ